MLWGDIYEFRPPMGTGHEQSGRRYGVVVQADEFLPTTRVLVEQVGAVVAGRLGDLVGQVSPEQQYGVND